MGMTPNKTASSTNCSKKKKREKIFLGKNVHMASSINIH
jgi:hypothetical protein